MARRASLIVLVGVLLAWPPSLLAQTKIDPGLTQRLLKGELVKVIIVTRPDPDQPDGGASFSNPAGYVASQLGTSSKNVRPLGQLPAVAAEVKSEDVAILWSDPNVQLVTEDVPVPPALFDSVDMIGANTMHASGVHGSKYGVAVLDTGIDSTHDSLSDSIVAQACFSTASSSVYKVQSLCPNGLDMSLLEGAAEGCPHDVEGCYHGTHVAGIVAGHGMTFDGHQNFEGVAPSAHLVPIQVFTLVNDAYNCAPNDPPCILSFTSDQLRALEYVYKRRDDFKIAAVNMSLGGGYEDKYCDSESALTGIIERLKSKGILTVIAAGNNGYYDAVTDPACISSAISVAAMKKDGSLDVSYSDVSPLVDLAAPGTNITSTVFNGGYRALSGTSMAAPHVAGAIALLRERHPKFSALEIEAVLKKSGSTVADPRTGTKLIKLMLSPPVTQAGVELSSDSAEDREEEGGGVAGWPILIGSSGSFIVKSTRSKDELQANLSKNCPQLDCNVKEIGESQYVIELVPKATLTPGERSKLNVDKASVKEMLGGGDVQVFDNRAAGILPAD